MIHLAIALEYLSKFSYYSETCYSYTLVKRNLKHYQSETSSFPFVGSFQQKLYSNTNFGIFMTVLGLIKRIKKLA